MWLAVVFTAIATAARPVPQPVDRATLVLVRSLSYDRSVARGTGDVRVGVVHDPQSTTVVDAVLEVLAGLRGVTVAGRSIGVPTAIPANAASDWTTLLRGYEAIVLCPGVDPALPAIVAAARELDVVLLALEPAYVGRGAALGVVMNGSQLELRVDPPEAVKQGAEYTGELLELAHPVP